MADERSKRPRKPRSKPTSGAESSAASDTGYARRGGDEGESVGGHAAFVVSHFGGGVEATPEILDRALAVWQRLPGAVVRSPAQIRPNRPAPPSGGDDQYPAS
jgi:hypothetical protein